MGDFSFFRLGPRVPAMPSCAQKDYYWMTGMRCDALPIAGRFSLQKGCELMNQKNMIDFNQTGVPSFFPGVGLGLPPPFGSRLFHGRAPSLRY